MAIKRDQSNKIELIWYKYFSRQSFGVHPENKIDPFQLSS